MKIDKLLALTQFERVITYKCVRSSLVSDFVAKAKAAALENVTEARLELPKELDLASGGLAQLKVTLCVTDGCTQTKFECALNVTTAMCKPEYRSYIVAMVLNDVLSKYALGDAVLASQWRAFTLDADVYVGFKLAIANAFSASWHIDSVAPATTLEEVDAKHIAMGAIEVGGDV